MYLWIVQHRNPIVKVFIAINCALAVLWLAAYRAVVLEQSDPRWFYINATLFGKIAIILYILTTIPGIFRRFGKFYKPVSVLMIFRRYIGIMTFMFVLLHLSIVRLFWIVKGQMSLIPGEIFIWFGFFAFTILFFLFITSNDWSVRSLGKWWQWIHNLTYGVGALVFIHVALQNINFWTMLILLDTLALIVSFLVSRRRSTIQQ